MKMRVFLLLALVLTVALATDLKDVKTVDTAPPKEKIESVVVHDEKPNDGTEIIVEATKLEALKKEELSKVEKSSEEKPFVVKSSEEAKPTEVKPSEENPLVVKPLETTPEKEESPEKPYRFVATLFTTCGSETRACTAVLISNTTVLSAPHCARIDHAKDCDVSYEICYHPGKCVAEVNDEYCRKINYIPEHNNNVQQKEGSEYVIIEQLAVFELDPLKSFNISQDIILPKVNPHIKSSDLKDVTGVVVWCDSGTMYVDLQSVVEKPGIASVRSLLSRQKSDKEEIHTMWVSETDSYTTGSLNQAASIFCVYGAESEDLYLIGLGTQEFTKIQTYTFVPACFEEVDEEKSDQINNKQNHIHEYDDNEMHAMYHNNKMYREKRASDKNRWNISKEIMNVFHWFNLDGIWKSLMTGINAIRG